MIGHLARVQALLAKGDVEGAKTRHNAAVVRVREAARNGRLGPEALQRRLPELRSAKAALDAAERRQ